MATATAMVQAQPGLDAREWDGAAYRQGILRERNLSCRTLFRAVFYDHHDEPDPHVLLAATSSDGSFKHDGSLFAAAGDTPVLSS